MVERGKFLSNKNLRGKLIVIEGGEGCGKTTQAERLWKYLSESGLEVYAGREPGGVEPAEEMRRILKNREYSISPIGELFGFNFARSEFYNRVVIPNLTSGINVILDRSGWSTEAYQGYAGGVDLNIIRQMNRISTRGVDPDLGIIIDVDPLTGLSKESEKDRISARGLEYHLKVREGFLKIAMTNARCKVVSYREGDVDGMQEEIREHVKAVLKK